jgi:membrane fusion protein, copper/silver efflux system
MKKNFISIKCFCFLLALFFVVASCTESATKHTDHLQTDSTETLHKTMYYCPMHPEVTSDKPGICPKCNMDLEPMPDKKTIDTLATLVQPTNSVVISSLKPITASANKGNARIGALGYLTYNPDYVNTISARVSGRIEKIYITHNFQKVSKGQKLLDIYSPELLTAQQEYLYVLESGDVDSGKALREKLLNLGLNEMAIKDMEKTKEASPYVTVYSTSDGHVHFLSGNMNMSAHALVWPEKISGDQMNGNAATNTELLRTGEYVKKGDPLFTIADQASIWALFKILPDAVSKIHLNEPVDVFINDHVYAGKINFIEKSFDANEDFYTVRVYLSCSDHSDLKIGTLIRGYISTADKANNALWVPRQAVLDLGKSSFAVFIKKEAGYTATEIKTGTRTNEWIEVLSGLTNADSIAPVASYLVDSEAFISTIK